MIYNHIIITSSTITLGKSEGVKGPIITKMANYTDLEGFTATLENILPEFCGVHIETGIALNQAHMTEGEIYKGQYPLIAHLDDTVTPQMIQNLTTVALTNGIALTVI